MYRTSSQTPLCFMALISQVLQSVILLVLYILADHYSNQERPESFAIIHCYKIYMGVKVFMQFGAKINSGKTHKNMMLFS